MEGDDEASVGLVILVVVDRVVALIQPVSEPKPPTSEREPPCSMCEGVE